MTVVLGVALAFGVFIGIPFAVSERGVGEGSASAPLSVAATTHTVVATPEMAAPGPAAGLAGRGAPISIRVRMGEPRTQESVYGLAVTPEPPVRTLETIIHGAAAIHGVDAPLMTRIARCESRMNPLARNPHSSASGLFQHLDWVWEYEVSRMGAPYALADRFNASASAMVAAFMMSVDGTRPWNESRECWG